MPPRILAVARRTDEAIRMARVLLLLACAVTQTAIAQAPQMSREELAAVKPKFTAERDAAAAYIRERPYFIRRMAERCREELRMPPSPSRGGPEESRWEYANYRYSAAGVRYRSKKTETGDPIVGFQTGLKEIGELREKVYAETDALLKAESNRAQMCRTFFADSEAGKLDVNTTDPHYETLEGLARELFDPLPRR
jgi:hypothetical protein